MTHYAVLVQELETYGRTTYRELVERHRGYTYAGFVAAAQHARRTGVITTMPREAHGYLVKAQHCPCCGRILEARV